MAAALRRKAEQELSTQVALGVKQQIEVRALRASSVCGCGGTRNARGSPDPSAAPPTHVRATPPPTPPQTLQAEEAARAQARQDLQTLLLGNESNRRARAAAAAAAAEADQRSMREYAAMLDRQVWASGLQAAQ